MSAGILVTALLCLTLGQIAADPVSYQNKRNLRIPVNIGEEDRKSLKEILLYVSTDQGANWQQTGRITADKRDFALYASQDGPHWLRIAVIDQTGKQEPDDKAIMAGPPHMKLVIDTRPPIIRVINAQRQGDEVLVNWELQEDNPDKNGIRLEYQVKDSIAETWTPIPAQFALNGQTAFRPGNSHALKVRITVRDLANNDSYAFAEVAGTIATTSFANPAGNNPPVPPPANPTTPQLSQLPTLPAQLQVQSNPPRGPERTVTPPPPPQPYVAQSSGAAQIFPRPSVLPGSGAVLPPPPPPVTAPTEKVVADSRVMPKPPPPTPLGTGRGGLDPIPGRPGTGPTSARRPLLDLVYIPNHQITLEYELRRVGPSGVGGIQVWLTRDDGITWEPFAEDASAEAGPIHSRHQRKFEFRDTTDGPPFADGIYGLALVVKSKAGLSHKPHPGTAPEVRVEIDTQAPVAVLYQPVPDPQRPDQVLLKWMARDKNLGTAHLEYAEKSDGPWRPIKLDLELKHTTQEVTGDYSWKVPEGTPVRIYLRLRVRDKAGNESTAVTPEPQFVDLTVPEGALIGAQPLTK